MSVGDNVKNTKIVFVDLDGTLKDSNKKISMRNKRIFERLADIGIVVVFTTGRPLSYTISLSKQFSSSNYVISSNGAEIYNYSNGNVIYHSRLSRENINKLKELIKKYQLFFIANCLTQAYTNKTFDDPGKKIVHSVDEITDLNISQLIVESYDEEVMRLFKNDISGISGIKISNKSRSSSASDQILFYDITNSDVSKGNAVKILCDYLNIDIKKTMAIGDSDNDIEMLQTVNVKVAMNNATEALKKEANFITLSNDEEGVAVILERLYNELTC